MASQELIKEYNKFREQYLKIAILLEANQILYEKVLQNQKEIKEIIGKGWGY